MCWAGGNGHKPLTLAPGDNYGLVLDVKKQQLTMQPASYTQDGAVTTGVQTFKGPKTFRGADNNSASYALIVTRENGQIIAAFRNDNVIELQSIRTLSGSTPIIIRTPTAPSSMAGLHIYPTGGVYNSQSVVRVNHSTTATNPFNNTINGIAIEQTIDEQNLSGTGVFRGLYINPSITQVRDYRAIVFTNNVGWGLYGEGTARNYLAGKLQIGSTTNIASAILQLDSTTQGFAPPRMTGAQAELIPSPEESLLVYATDGSGVTITSKGWWGFDGATWVKLN